MLSSAVATGLQVMAQLMEADVEAVAGPKGFRRDTTLTRELLAEYPRSQWWQFAVVDDQLMSEIEAMQKQYD